MVESRRVDVRRNRWAACLSACLVLAAVPELALGQCPTPGTVINYGNGDYEVFQDHDGDGCVDCIDYFDAASQAMYDCVGQGDDPDPSNANYSCVNCVHNGTCEQYGPPGGWLPTGCFGCSCGHNGDGTCATCADPCDGLSCQWGCTNGVCNPDPCASCAYGCTNGVCDDPPECPYGGTYPDCNDPPECEHGGTYPDCDPPPECDCGGTYPNCEACPCECGESASGECLPCECDCGEDANGDCLPCEPECACENCDTSCDENHPEWPRCTPCCAASECEASNPWECDDCDCLEVMPDMFDYIVNDFLTALLPESPNINGDTIEIEVEYPLPGRVGTTTSRFAFTLTGDIVTDYGLQGVSTISNGVKDGIALCRQVFLYMLVYKWFLLAVSWWRVS